MSHVDTATEIGKRGNAFRRKWTLKGKAVADSLQEAGDRLFALIRPDSAQWRATRMTDATEPLNEKFGRRTKTQTGLLWALLASGRISMRKVDGWQALDKPIAPMHPDLAA